MCFFPVNSEKIGPHHSSVYWVAWLPDIICMQFFQGKILCMGTTIRKKPAPWLFHTKKHMVSSVSSSISSTCWSEKNAEMTSRISLANLYINYLQTRTKPIEKIWKPYKCPLVSQPSHVCTFKWRQWTLPVRRCLIKMNEKFQCFLPLATLLTSHDDLKNILISLGRVVVLGVQSPVDAEKQGGISNSSRSNVRR